MLQLVNDKCLMGRLVNGRMFNALAWAMVLVLILLTVILSLTSIFPTLLGA